MNNQKGKTIKRQLTKPHSRLNSIEKLFSGNKPSLFREFNPNIGDTFVAVKWLLMHPSAICVVITVWLSLVGLHEDGVSGWVTSRSMLWNYSFWDLQKFVTKSFLHVTKMFCKLKKNDTHETVASHQATQRYVCTKVSSPTCTLICYNSSPIHTTSGIVRKKVKNIQSFNETYSRRAISADRFLFLLLFLLLPRLLAPVVVSFFFSFLQAKVWFTLEMCFSRLGEIQIFVLQVETYK